MRAVVCGVLAPSPMIQGFKFPRNFSSPQAVEKYQRPADVELGVKDRRIQKVSVIGHKMGSVSVEGAQHKGNVIRIRRVMPQVEESHWNNWPHQ